MINGTARLIPALPYVVTSITTTSAGAIDLIKGDAQRIGFSVSLFGLNATVPPPHLVPEGYLMPGRNAADGIGLQITQSNSPLVFLFKDIGAVVNDYWTFFSIAADIELTVIEYRYTPANLFKPKEKAI